tara:strand:+ start:14817 stop:15329 length:513 start_codon:yes stop_codon:yes gene_type:complete
VALVKEDGSIVSGAESYVTVAEADAYWADRGDPAQWTDLTTAQKESALRQATQYLETNYNWKSCLQDVVQPLAFPRLPFYDKEGRLLAGEGVIPQKVKDAQIELALRHAIQNLLLDTNPQDDNILRERVGDHEVQYKSGSTKTYSFSYVQSLLRSYVLSSTFNEARIIRG